MDTLHTIEQLQDVCYKHMDIFSKEIESLGDQTNIDLNEIAQAKQMLSYYTGGWKFLGHLKWRIENV